MTEQVKIIGLKDADCYFLKNGARVFYDEPYPDNTSVFARYYFTSTRGEVGYYMPDLGYTFKHETLRIWGNFPIVKYI